MNTNSDIKFEEKINQLRSQLPAKFTKLVEPNIENLNKIDQFSVYTALSTLSKANGSGYLAEINNESRSVTKYSNKNVIRLKLLGRLNVLTFGNPYFLKLLGNQCAWQSVSYRADNQYIFLTDTQYKSFLEKKEALSSEKKRKSYAAYVRSLKVIFPSTATITHLKAYSPSSETESNETPDEEAMDYND